MKISDLEDRVVASYSARMKADAKSIDPAVVAMIIDTIMKVVQMCMANNNTPKGIKEFVDKRPVLARLAVRRQMTQNDLEQKNAREVIETVVGLGRMATEQDIADVPNMTAFVFDPSQSL